MPDWNVVYTQKKIEQASPANVLCENAHVLSSQSTALDFASGLAGNGLYLAAKGYAVSAWDLSSAAVNKINVHAEKNQISLQASVHDLENALPEVKNKFDVVVVSYFLHRESLRYLYDILKPGGLLFYQTFSGERYQEKGPARSEFRLQPNELLNVFSDMQLLFYREDDINITAENSRQGQVYFVARK